MGKTKVCLSYEGQEPRRLEKLGKRKKEQRKTWEIRRWDERGKCRGGVEHMRNYCTCNSRKGEECSREGRVNGPARERGGRSCCIMPSFNRKNQQTPLWRVKWKQKGRGMFEMEMKVEVSIVKSWFFYETPHITFKQD